MRQHDYHSVAEDKYNRTGLCPEWQKRLKHKRHGFFLQLGHVVSAFGDFVNYHLQTGRRTDHVVDGGGGGGGSGDVHIGRWCGWRKDVSDRLWTMGILKRDCACGWWR